ncbi:unnamed protein product [Caenorhabditis angaria]|uniref:Uncharacterized protein n=1 Tax=Caenorhabditis angaria TaxID=860376 RepID=A0A9P1IRX0_9PELO|nr:unnamed protein product [Caenorhabditis angaria]
MLINTFCMVFPWTIIMAHRKIKTRVLNFIGFRSARIQQYGSSNVRSLEGNIIDHKPSQNAYFEQLNDIWKIT